MLARKTIGHRVAVENFQQAVMKGEESRKLRHRRAVSATPLLRGRRSDPLRITYSYRLTIRICRREGGLTEGPTARLLTSDRSPSSSGAVREGEKGLEGRRSGRPIVSCLPMAQAKTTGRAASSLTPTGPLMRQALV